MVKISIKKEEKTIKPKQKQKQKQSQKVVVNIGNDVFKPKRKRAPRQALQKGKVVNRQQTTPTQINAAKPWGRLCISRPLFRLSDHRNGKRPYPKHCQYNSNQ